MRAYLAILKDSFREAMSSWVLWLAMAAILLLLLGLAPFSLLSETATELRPREMFDPEQFVTALDEDKANKDTPAGHIWSLMESDDQARIQEMINPDEEDNRPGGGPRGRGSRRITRIINKLLPQEYFYKAAVWPGVEVDDDLRDKLEDDSLLGKELASRNLRLLAATFPEAIRIRDSQQVSLTYAGRVVAGPLPITRDDLKPLITSIMANAMSWFLGFFGVFASLLVTATIVPRTFEPGEIALLLSKPVTRSLLFITKFVGACAFTLLCASTLVGGVWLLLGLRFQIWEPKLLYCIPVYLFLFAVYYSVSATAGLIWRNAIVALVMVVLFWLVLFIVGQVKGSLDEFSFKQNRVTEIVPAGDKTFTVNGNREVLLFDSTDEVWNKKFDRNMEGIPSFVQRFIFAGTRFRPIYDSEQNRLIAVEQRPSPFGGATRANVVTGTPDGDWERVVQAETPGPVIEVFLDSKNRVVLPGRRGIYEFIGMSEAERKSKKFFDSMLGGLMSAPNRKAFGELHSADMPDLGPKFVSALNLTDDSLFMYSDGKLHRLDTTDKKYGLTTSRDFETEENAVLAVGGSSLTIAFGDGSIHVLDPKSLEDKVTDQLDEGILPRVCASSTDGSASAILTHDGNLWVYDGKADKVLDWRPPEDGSASAVAFNEKGELLIGDGRQGVSAYAVGSSDALSTQNVPGDWVTRLYDWVLTPIASVFPQPGEVDAFVQYLLTGQRSQSIADNGEGPANRIANLQEDRVTFRIWRPLFKNVAFVVVLLGFGCFYVSRKDF